jgi:hypothetical protein
MCISNPQARRTSGSRAAAIYMTSRLSCSARIQWLGNWGGISMRVQRIDAFLTVFSIGCLSRLPTQQANINLDHKPQKDRD